MSNNFTYKYTTKMISTCTLFTLKLHLPLRVFTLQQSTEVYRSKQSPDKVQVFISINC